MRALRSTRVVTPEGIRPATVWISAHKIAAIDAWDAFPDHEPAAHDLGELALLPGAVDTHVHVNEPGRADWEGFASATRAALAGGVTSLVDMPLNSIPATTSAVALVEKRRAANGQISCDVGFWGGVVPGNLGDLTELASAGVLGFKAFLSPSGVAEFEHVDAEQLEAAACLIAPLGLPLLVHAEAPPALDRAEAEVHRSGLDRRSYASWLAARPVSAEVDAIALLGRIALATGAHLHVVHLSSSAGLATVDAARRAGARLTAETCPHYLTFSAEEIADGATAWKCAPPIRERAEREALWGGLRDRTLALVASDHSPSPPHLKARESGDFFSAWGGISSLQVALPVLWTGAVRRGFGLGSLVQWIATGPAALAGLDHRKGRIAPGFDADLVAFDPDGTFPVEGAKVYHRHAMTPYEGMTLRGIVRATYLGGRRVFHDGSFVSPPSGSLLERERL